MTDFRPYTQGRLWIDREFFGVVLQPRKSLSWSIPAMIGAPGVTTSGLVLDPTGQYAMFRPVYIPQASDTTQWTTTTVGFVSPIWTSGTDESSSLQFLMQMNYSIGVAGTATWISPRQKDVGLKLDIWRGAPAQTPGVGATAITAANYNMYVYPSALNSTPSDPVCRVAIEAGNAIRLDVSLDAGATWTSVDEATGLGESESYLNSRQRRLTIEFVPQFDQLWWAEFDTASLVSGPPPDQLAVVINGGDAVLVWKAQAGTLADGYARIAVTGGGWTAKYIKRRSVTTATIKLPVQTRPSPFLTDPDGRTSGYLPFTGMAVVTPVPVKWSQNAFGALLTITAPAEDIDGGTGYAFDTPYLSTAILDFPAVFQERGILTAPITINGFYSRDTHSFQQNGFLRRSWGEIQFSDTQGLFAPGRAVALAVRGVTLTRGFTAPGGYDDGGTALTGICGRYAWQYVDGELIVKLFLADRFQQIAPDDPGPILGEQIDGDGQCHYYLQRLFGYRLGLLDEDMLFPFCDVDSPCQHYHMPRGTTFDPAFRFPAQMGVMQAMLLVRKFAAEFDTSVSTDFPLPMYLYFDTGGCLNYFGAPIGLVQTWLDPSLNPVQQGLIPWKVFGGPPRFDGLGYGQLNEIKRGLGSEVSLANIRTPIVLEGMRPQDGGFVLAYFNNPAIGGGPLADPWAAGYRGLDMPYIEINKFYTSAEAADIAIQIAAVQMSFPATSTGWVSPLQSGLFPLMPVAVQDFATQGTPNAVNYYSTWTDHVVDVNNVDHCQTEVRARLLGQAA